MRAITIITLIALTSVSGLAPAVAQANGSPPECQYLTSGVFATRERPGSYLGNLKGELAGAFSLFTLESAEDVKGVVTSSVLIRFISPDTKGDSFTALLEVHEPIGADFHKYHGLGSFLEGTGIFAGIEGKMEITGQMARRKGILEGELTAGFCTG